MAFASVPRSNKNPERCFRMYKPGDVYLFFRPSQTLLAHVFLLRRVVVRQVDIRPCPRRIRVVVVDARLAIHVRTGEAALVARDLPVHLLPPEPHVLSDSVPVQLSRLPGRGLVV